MTGLPDLARLAGQPEPQCLHPALCCPHCREHVCIGHRVDTGETMEPTPGVATVCVFCTMPAVFERNPLGVIVLRMPTEQEAAEFANDPRYRQAVDSLERAGRAVRFGQNPARGGLWTPETSR